MERKNNWKAWFYLAPVILLLAVFTFFPLINTFITSFFKEYGSSTEGFTGSGFTFDNYLITLGLKPYGTGSGFEGEQLLYYRDVIDYAIPNTLILLVTVPISIFIALLIAVSLNAIPFFKKIFQTIFFIPYVTNVIAVGMVFAVIFSEKGLWNYIFNLGEFNWLSSSREKALFVLCLYIVWNALPYKILIFLSGLQGIDKQYYQAAKIDATPKWRVFTRITVPLLSPQIFYIMVTSFMGSFKEYSAVVGLFGKSYTASATQKNLYTIVYYIYDNIKGKPQYAAAAAVMLFVVIMLFTGLQFWVGNKRVHY